MTFDHVSPSELKILHEDESCLVVLKPPGLPTQAPREFDSLEKQIRALLARRIAGSAQGSAEPRDLASDAAVAASIYLGLPHRLDRAVSGVIVLTKTRRAARKLSRQFERREIGKTYWALVAGTVDPPAGTWIDTMRKIPELPRSELVAEYHPDAQRAVLHYRTLGPMNAAQTADQIAEQNPAMLGTATCLEIELETGRMHQIRLQAASRGHPVLGDSLYGSNATFGIAHEDWRQRSIAVHARSLEFKHPDTNERMKFVAPAPEEWLGLSEPST